MHALKARVENGYLVLRERTELPEGTVVQLELAGEDDELDDAQRAALHEALRRSVAQMKAGQVKDGDEVVARLLKKNETALHGRR